MTPGDATRIPTSIPPDAQLRLRRLRALAWFLDTSIDLGKSGRFGVDPLLGLIPVVGDWLGALTSLYIVYEAMRLGVSWAVITRMLGNVVVDLVLGAVPVLGDVFDFVWQSNRRNVRLVDRHYHHRLRPRPLGSIAFFLGAVILLILALAIGAVWAMVWLIRRIHLFG